MYFKIEISGILDGTLFLNSPRNIMETAFYDVNRNAFGKADLNRFAVHTKSKIRLRAWKLLNYYYCINMRSHIPAAQVI